MSSISSPGPNFSFATASGNSINIANEAAFTIGGHCAYDAANRKNDNSLAMAIPGIGNSIAVCSASNTWSLTVDASSLPQGLLTVTASQNDTLGNTTTAVQNYLKDTINPTISLISSPTAGQLFTGGSLTTITWTAADNNNLPINSISLAYSTNSGTSWITSASGIPNTGSYIWLLPLINSSNVLVKVMVTDVAGNTASAQSVSVFSVDSNAPILTLTDFNTAGTIFAGGSTQTITWTATSSFLGVTPINLDYSANGGSTWTSIAANLANSGSYSWTLPTVDGNSFKVRVTATDLVGYSSTAVSTNPFTIDSTSPVVSLTAPVTGQYFAGALAGATDQITWSASDTNFSPTPILIEYSANSGSTWTTIASSMANLGYYNWSTAALAVGSTYQVRITATDRVGHSTQSVSGNFTITNLIPNLTQTTLASPYITQAVSQVTFGGACDLGATMTSGTNITVAGADTATIPCTGSAPTGTWTYTTQAQSTDGNRSYTFSQTNGAALSNVIAVNWIRDTTPPVVSGVVINNGAQFLNTTMASVQVTATDALTASGMLVRIAATNATDAAGNGVNCQTLYANSNWQNQTNATMTYSTLVPDGNGYKKICAWAKDGAGNVSTIFGIGSLGVDMSVTQYANSTPPVITAFNVMNAGTGGEIYNVGDEVQISWTVTDALGLTNNPITLDYTTNGYTWITIVSNYGNLSGNPLTYSNTYTGFNAPSAGFFRVRIRAQDITGQTSQAVISKIQNSGQWSTYAGTTDRGIGGTAQSAVLYRSAGARKNSFAIDPVTGDLYTFDDQNGGLLKIDAITGIVSQFIPCGASTNLPTTTTWSPMPSSPTYYNQASPGLVTFDSNRRLYFMLANVTRTQTSTQIYQIDLSTNQIRLYVGSATALGYDATATPTSIFVNATDYEFDESNSMYFFTTCSPGYVWNGVNNAATRLMKLTQNADGSAGNLNVVAGDCSAGTPTSGSLATNTAVGTNYDTLYYSISAWNNGADIYYSDGFTGTYKIINGTIYSTAIAKSQGLIYSASANQIYMVPSPTTSLKQYSVSLAGANGETLTSTIVGSGGTGANCNADGISATSTCVNFDGGLALNEQGQLFFGAGSVNSPVRIRYVDSGGIMRTFAGTLPFFGDGLDKSLIKGFFTGIYFKQNSEPNQASFPSGLYFVESHGMVIGYIDDVSGMTTARFGSQSGITPSLYATGTALSTGASLGGSTLSTLTFDSQGLPWFVYGASGIGSVITSIDVNGNVVRRQQGVSGLWDYVVAGTNSLNTTFAGVFGYPELQVKNQGVFLLNKLYNPPPNPSQAPLMSFLDFTGSTTGSTIRFDIMGNTGTTASPDTTVPGSLAGLSFSSYCVNWACRTQYIPVSAANPSNDLLYFSEGQNLRFVTNPTTPANSLLTTVFTASSNINNFILSLDQSQAFYLMSGSLYCHTLSGTPKSWCNDTSLGPPAGMNTISAGGNQFTWHDSSNLLISDYNGDIYEYTLLP